MAGSTMQPHQLAPCCQELAWPCRTWAQDELEELPSVTLYDCASSPPVAAL